MPTILDPQSAEYLSLVKNLSSHERELVIAMLKQLYSLSDTHVPSEEDVFVEALAGRTFSDEERIKLELDTLFQYFQWRRQLLKGALTSSQVAQLLGTSRQTPHDRVKARTLLGISDNGALRFPSWQFDPEGPDGVIEGLPDVLKTLQVSDLAKLSWLVRSNPFLEGLTPVQALKQGQKERVVQEAMGVGIS
jgi:hypothetical protein